MVTGEGEVSVAEWVAVEGVCAVGICCREAGEGVSVGRA